MRTAGASRSASRSCAPGAGFARPRTLSGRLATCVPRFLPNQGSRVGQPSAASTSAPTDDQVVIPVLPKGPLVGPALVQLLHRFKRLQNGSDVRGIAIAGVPKEPVSLTPGIAHFIGYAFAKWLEDKRPAGSSGPVRVSVGRDPRLSGPMMEAALVSGLASAGAHVDTFDIATTPCMFYSIVASGLHTQKDRRWIVTDTHLQGYTGAIMLTASHMPFNSNGLKFFTAEGGLEKGDISALLQGATQACAAAGVLAGEPLSENAHMLRAAMAVTPSQVNKVDFLPKYAAFLRACIKKGVCLTDDYSTSCSEFPLQGLKIVVDAGNGSGGFFADLVLAPLGADTTGSRFLDPDGSFPNHVPNPEHPSAMKSGREAVLEVGADLGIVFDTDVDRSAIVDSTGSEINSNRFIALMSAITLREHPGSTVVTDSVTSNGLTEFITKLGGKHVRYKRGYKNVIGKGVELNKAGEPCHLMMETSGHGAVKENWFLDDGSFMAVQVVIEMCRRMQTGTGGIGELLAALPEALESQEVRARINEVDFKPIGKKALEAFHAHIMSGAEPSWSLEEFNHEGWRVNVDEGDGKKGWLLLRQSLHDPLLVLNCESEVAGGCRAGVGKVLAFFSDKCAGMPLDLAKMEAAAK